MPNTPALVFEGCTGVCFNDLVSAEEKELAMKLFNCLGKGFEVPEKLFYEPEYSMYMYDGKHVDSLDKVSVIGENFPNYPYTWTSIDLKDMFNK